MGVYYVRATVGSDTNDGLTPATAFRTVQKAIDVWVETYKTNKEMLIYVGPGVYEGFSSQDVFRDDRRATHPEHVFGPDLTGRHLIVCGDPTGVVTGDAPGRVEIAYGSIWVWTSDTFYPHDPVCVNGYSVTEIRNIFNIRARCGFVNYYIGGDYSSVPVVVGSKYNPPPINKDTIALIVRCYNCQGTFGGDPDPGVVQCFNCVGTFAVGRHRQAVYNLDLGTQAWNSIGIFTGYNADNRVGAYYCCIQRANTYVFKGPGTFNGDPKFVDNINYYLRADSPCIDAGCDVDDRPTDIMGVRAPQGLAHDMGIHEYVSDLFYNDLNITKPRYRGYDVLDYVEGTIPVLAPVDGHYPLISIYVQIAKDPAFTPQSIIVNTCSDYGFFEYQDVDGSWRQYPPSGAGPDLYGRPFRCNIYNLSSPKGTLLFLKTWAVYK